MGRLGKGWTAPPPLYEERYRGVCFHITCTGYLMMRDRPPGAALRWGGWSRFFTADELATVARFAVGDPAEPMAAIARRGIDRALEDAPCYTGSIVERLPGA